MENKSKVLIANEDSVGSSMPLFTHFIGSGAYYEIPNNIAKVKKAVEEDSSDPVEKHFMSTLISKSV